MFTYEQAVRAKGENPAENGLFIGGITLAKRIDVKKIGIFRMITVGIGILVAVLIALTLWIGMPGERPSGESSPPGQSAMPFAASSLFETIQSSIVATPEP